MSDECTAASGGQPAEGISTLIVMVGRSHRLLAGELLADLELHAGQGAMIQLLGSDRLSQRELAERLGVEPPTVTRMVQRMEHGGLIERCTDARDGRVSRIRLSPHGLSLRRQVAERWATLEERSTAGLSAAELEQLRLLLLRVHANLAGAAAPAEGAGSDAP